MLLKFHFLAVFICISRINGELTPRERLRNDLLKNYNKELRPVINSSDTVEVEMFFAPKHLLQLDEKTEMLTTEGYIYVKWTDEHLKWDSLQYGMAKITLADHEIWQPDLFILYSSGTYSIDQGHNTYVYITNQGDVSWNPPASFSVPCVTNFRYYPFDTHTCEYNFVSWGHNGDKLHLIPSKDISLNTSAITGQAWKVISYNMSAKMVYMGSNYPYNIALLTLVIQRAGSLYKYSTVFPVIFSAALTLAGFWLEIWNTSRYILGITNFVVVSLQLLNLSTALPVGGDVPILAQFSATAVTLSTAFLTLTVTLDSLGRRKTAPNERLVRLLKSVPTSVLCVTQFSTESRLANEQTNQGDAGSIQVIKDDWLLVCMAFDRLFFWIFALIYAIVTGYLLAF